MAESKTSPIVSKGQPKPIVSRFKHEQERLHHLLQSADEHIAYGLNLDKDHYDELVHLLHRFSNH